MDFKNKKVLVIGLGESGLAMCKWLNHCGAILRVADTRQKPDRLDALKAHIADVEFIGGELSSHLLNNVDAVFVSPGLSPHRELKHIYQDAKEKNLAIWGELELFAIALNDLRNKLTYQPKIIAITGTNGKTTVTRLTGLLCSKAGLSVQVAGNVSPSMLDSLLACVGGHTENNSELPQVWVLELSSFQLHSQASLQADVATVLNITQDHLDWHVDMQEYIQDKGKIFGEQTLQILNRDDALVMSLAKNSSSKNKIHTFGMNAPQSAGDFGLLNENGMLWLCVAPVSENTEKFSRRKQKEREEEPLFINKLMPLNALHIKGLHNASNALAALALCRGIGLGLAPLLHGLRDYRGEPHRVEFVRQVVGVNYFDDSKGTNVGATVAALQGMGESQPHSKKKIILIAGGDGKGQDFSPLEKPINEYVKVLLAIGKDGSSIQRYADKNQVHHEFCSNLEIAVMRASELAVEGDLVLLSPACASFDMFQNYEHRANVFIDAVNALALDKGEAV